MDIVLIKGFGVLYVLAGLGILLNFSTWYEKLLLLKNNPVLIKIFSLLAFSVGLLIIFVFKFNENFIHILMIIIALLAILKGVVLLLLPNMVFDLAERIYRNNALFKLTGVLCVGMGTLFILG